MQIIGPAALLLVSLVMESTVLESLKIFGVKPDLVLVWVVLLALVWGPRRGAVVGFLFGFVEDLFFAKYIGVNALVKMAVGFIIGLGEGRLVKENIIVPVIAVITGSLVFWLSTLVLDFYLGRLLNFDLSILLASFLYNSVVALVSYRQFYKLGTNGETKVEVPVMEGARWTKRG
ncbi:MAG: rod shape-determining protein MreD [Thermoanaerobacteraceae bacterium]|nr:rod shape-determining protein MreD [Thermoanaerobacteraceae bacterium]